MVEGVVPLPVGEKCVQCGETVVDGDCGMMTGVIATGEATFEVRPLHIECMLVGILGHEYGVCWCTGYDTTTRAAALELARVMRRG